MLSRCLVRLAPAAVPLSAPAVTQALQGLRGWRRNGNSLDVIERDYLFADFKEALAFMNAVAAPVEEAQHHPLWTNVYNRLSVRFTTHDAGNKVTEKDIHMARVFNQVYDKMQAEKQQ